MNIRGPNTQCARCQPTKTFDNQHHSKTVISDFLMLRDKRVWRRLRVWGARGQKREKMLNELTDVNLPKTEGICLWRSMVTCTHGTWWLFCLVKMACRQSSSSDKKLLHTQTACTCRATVKHTHTRKPFNCGTTLFSFLYICLFYFFLFYFIFSNEWHFPNSLCPKQITNQ